MVWQAEELNSEAKTVLKVRRTENPQENILDKIIQDLELYRTFSRRKNLKIMDLVDQWVWGAWVLT